jgi:predicted Zn-dependent peptidase
MTAKEIPFFHKTTLDNGLRVLTAPMPHLRSVAISFFIGTGSRYETDPQAGISHFIEHLVFRGTKKRPTSHDISVAIEGVGGILNGGTDKELTLYWCKVARPHFAMAFDVLTDMLLNAKFDPADIDKERGVVIEEIKMNNDAPSQRVGMLMEELLWSGHPLGRDIIGTPESIKAMTRDMFLDYLASQYQPSHTVLALAGNVEHNEMVTAAVQALGKWTDRKPRPKFLPYQEKPAQRVKIETRDTEQVQLCLGLPGLSLLDPKRFRLDLLNVILGEGMSSRLFAEIRDKLGLAYSIHSYLDHLLDTGALVISAGVETKNLKLAVTSILEQLARLKDPVPEEELTKAKEYSKGRLLLRMEDSYSVAGWMGGQEILTGRIRTVDEVVRIIDAITVRELQELARELLVGDKVRLSVVGPVPEDEPLESLLKI